MGILPLAKGSIKKTTLLAQARMKKKLPTDDGRRSDDEKEIYKQRAYTGEVNFASLKRGRKFRQVSVRGLYYVSGNVSGEFCLL